MKSLLLAVFMVLATIPPYAMACGFFGSEAERQEEMYDQLFGSRAWLKQFPWAIATKWFPWNHSYAVFELTRERPRPDNDSRHSGVIVYAYSPTAEIDEGKGERVDEVHVIAFIVIRENRVVYRAVARGYLDRGMMSGEFERYNATTDLALAVLNASKTYSTPIAVVSTYP